MRSLLELSSGVDVNLSRAGRKLLPVVVYIQRLCLQ